MGARSGQLAGMFGPSLMMIVSGFCTTTSPVASTESTNSWSACFGVIGKGAMIVTLVACFATSALNTMFLQVNPITHAARSRSEVSGWNSAVILVEAGAVLHVYNGSSSARARCEVNEAASASVSARRNMPLS